MDTRFWGPAGWKLLHIASFVYEPSQAKEYKRFFETLPYILPCKYCRASLTDYYRELPIDGELDSRTSLTKWMYNIHNKVNEKLRSQGLNPSPDPSFKKVSEFYEKWLSEGTPLCRLTTFWDFLFAVAYNHPRQTAKASTPMPNCPEYAYKCTDKCERNKWNTLPLSDRLTWFYKFWVYLPDILEEPLRKTWIAAAKRTRMDISCRRSTVAWLWRMRCALDPDFHDPYTQVCSTLSSFSSGCSKARRGKTCRRTRK